MSKRLWSALAALAVISTTGIAAYVIASPGGEEESVRQVETATASATLTATPVDQLPAATLSSFPSLPPIPEDWSTYVDPGGLFRIRYPPTWFETEDGFVSTSPGGKAGPLPDSIGVAISTHLDDGYGCGVLRYELGSGTVSPEQGAVPIALGSIEAWSVVRRPGDPLLNDPYTRIEAVSTIYKGHCFNIAAYFTQENPDIVVFPRIVSGFEFNF